MFHSSKTSLPKFTQTLNRSLKPFSSLDIETTRIANLINNHPFPNPPLHTSLKSHIPPSFLSPPLISNVLTRLHTGHTNGLKAYDFFKYSLLSLPHTKPSSDAFETTLRILVRMRDFTKILDLMKEVRRLEPSLLTVNSMSIVLCMYTRLGMFDETLRVFEEMEKEVFVGIKVFGVEEFNVLIRAFCVERKMTEVRAVFRKMYSRFKVNTETLNVLLMGFKETGDVRSVELFYYDMARRGYKADVVTYNIRIDAYCKKGRLNDGLRLLGEMERLNYLPTMETIVILIRGACVAENVLEARRLFDEISLRGLSHDVVAYNALICTYIRFGDIEDAMKLMDEMEGKGIGYDNFTYYTMLIGLKKRSGIEGVCKLYERMVESNFVPKARTVMMLMKIFCENKQVEVSLDLWRYLLRKGCCVHGHVMDVLVKGLCWEGRVDDAYEFSMDMLKRGRPLTEVGVGVLKKFLEQSEKTDELKKLVEIMKTLQDVGPSGGQVISLNNPTIINVD